MKGSIRSHAVLTSVLALVSLAAWGQDLTLFQDSGNNNPRAQFAPAGPPTAATAAPSAPAMVLTGIYRFGDVYHVSLKSEDGAVYKATWQSGQAVGATFNGYAVQAVDSRTVTLGMPAGVACQQSASSGSSCLGRSQVALSFAETEPVSSRQNRPTSRNTTTFSRNDNGDNNPFGRDQEQLRALIDAARSGNDAAANAARELIRNRAGNDNGNGNGNGNGGRGGRGGRGGFGGGNNGGGNNGGGNNGGGNNNGGGRGGNGFF